MWLTLVSAHAEEPAQAGMIGHFETATTTALSVAVGDLKAARKAAAELADRSDVPAPVREKALAVEACRKIECAATAAAGLARSCSTCHVTEGRGPNPTGVDQIPLLRPAEQHAYAGLFLWIGLVTPHEQAFAVGLKGAVPPVDLDSDDSMYQMLEQFKGLVAATESATSWDERAGGFERMLVVCAECHRRGGVDKRLMAEAE